MSTKNSNAYGLKSKVLSPIEVLSQSIANIAPTASPTVVIPLVFALAGNGTWLAYLFATVAVLFTAWSINVFAKDSASPGTFYIYISKAFGNRAGVLTGWALLIAYIGTASAVTGGFTNYFNVFLEYFGLSAVNSIVLTLLTVAAAWFVAYRDIKLSVRLMLILELSSVGLIFLLTVITLIVSPSVIDSNQLSLQNVSFDQIRLGLVLAIFSFVGFESATSLGEEAKNPLKNIPRALVISALFVGTFFVFSSYSLVLGFEGSAETLDKSGAPLNYLATRGNVGFLIPFISLGAVISFFACTLACINAGARILFHMSLHGLFHDSVAKTHTTNKTPHVAITIASILTFLPAAILSWQGVGPFDIYGWVGTIATLGFIVTYIAISVAAPFYLKKKGKLNIKGVLIPSVSVILFVIALIGNVYPVPPYPYNVLPYIFFGLLLIGVVWFAFVTKNKPEVGNSIRTDIQDIDDKFASLDSSSL